MRPAPVVLAILRAALPEVFVVSVIPDVDHRRYPLVAVRRVGGVRHPRRPTLLAFPEIELTAVSADSLVDAELLYENALEALYAAVSAQTVVYGAGCLHSLTEAQGATDVGSPFPDTWAVQGTVQIGVRPAL